MSACCLQLSLRQHTNDKRKHTLLRASKTSEGAKLSSSKMIQWPFLMASTRTPVKGQHNGTKNQTLCVQYQCGVQSKVLDMEGHG